MTTAAAPGLADAAAPEVARAVAVLRMPATIRERCESIRAAVAAGESRAFALDESKLPDAADIVVETTRARYPDLVIPYHSRWRHFEAGGIDRAQRLVAVYPDAADRGRAMIDLAMVSVLLDAGAGAAWRYRDAALAAPLARSEGLGVASFDAFARGLFSARRDRPWCVDAIALQRLRTADLAVMFQVDADNPLVGLEGRAELLRRLGRVLADRSDWFGPDGRPGAMFDRLGAGRRELGAGEILSALLETLSPIWLAGNALDGVALGDCWRHPHAGGEGESAGWVPFHKLSQWLAYSLFEPFETGGLAIVDRDALTGLPEYRNGGLFLDTGVFRLRDPSLASRTLAPGDEAVIEWRALTVCALDRVAVLVRERLGLDAAALPLACVLEGGTWAAGRVLAGRLRDGLPPLSIDSDGTVF